MHTNIVFSPLNMYTPYTSLTNTKGETEEDIRIYKVSESTKNGGFANLNELMSAKGKSLRTDFNECHVNNKGYWVTPFMTDETTTCPPLHSPKNKQVNVYDKIIDNLYVGGIESSKTKWNEFSLIVNCTKDLPFPSQTAPVTSSPSPLVVGGYKERKPPDQTAQVTESREKSVAGRQEPSSPECIRIPVDDTPDESESMMLHIIDLSVLERINEAIVNDQSVLVHCYAGMQRSCAVIVCYLIKYYGITPQTAIEHVKKNRPMAFFGGVNFMQTIQNQYTLNDFMNKF